MGLINFLKQKFSKHKDEKPSEAAAPSQKEEPKKEEPKKETEEEIDAKYVAGLDRSRIGFTEKLKKLASSNKIVNADYFTSLERILIEADVGVDLTLELIKETQREASAKEITDANALNDLLIDKRFISYANKGGSFSTEITRAKEGPTVVFRCGVNGVGMLGNAATNLTFPFVTFSMAIGTMIADGCVAYFSLKLGEKNYSEAEKTMGNGISIALMAGVLMTLLMEIFIDAILVLCGGSTVDPQTYEFAKQYARVLTFLSKTYHDDQTAV